MGYRNTFIFHIITKDVKDNRDDIKGPLIEKGYHLYCYSREINQCDVYSFPFTLEYMGMPSLEGRPFLFFHKNSIVHREDMIFLSFMVLM